jgi:predicted Zn-dependent peptidase
LATYLVTGGGGFIGSNIVDALVRRGETVRVLDDFSTGKRENLADAEGKITLIVGSVADEPVVRELMPRDDAVKYYKTYYAPYNEILIIVGDFDTKRALELVHTYYDDIPAQTPPEPVRTVEPEQLGERRAELHKAAEMPAVLVGYHIPDVKSNDIYALDILQYVLSEGESSRLYKKLVRDLGIAVYAGANASWNIAPALFVVDVKAKPDKTAAECETAVYDILKDIASNGITPAELAKAKNQVEANFYRSMQTVNGKARKIGTYEIYFGDFNEILKVQDRYQAVAADDVKRVAGQYFSPKNRTVVTLVPEA